jgi:hypothetical protein
MTKIGLTTYVEVIKVTALSSHFNTVNVIVGSSRWQNPGNRFDVMGDGVVNINDYNAIVNYIAANGNGVLPRNKPKNEPYVDVNGDGIVNDQDIAQLLAYLQNKKVIDTTATTQYAINDIKLERDLVDPATVSIIKDVAAKMNIFPLNDYLVYLRDLSTNNLTLKEYTDAVASRDSLVFVNKNTIVATHPFTEGCYKDSCVFRLIKARISQSEILPIRFNKTIATSTVESGTGLPMPGTDTSEMPTPTTVADVEEETITYVEQATTTVTTTTATATTTTEVVKPEVTILDTFPNPCVIIGEIKLVRVETNGSKNTSTTACTAKMTSNTTPSPYVSSADSEALFVVEKWYTTAQQMTDACKNSGLAGAENINSIDGQMHFDAVTELKIAEIATGLGSVVISGSLVEEHYTTPWDNFLSYWDGSSFQCKSAVEMGNSMIEKMGCSNSILCPAWKAFNRTNTNSNDKWTSNSGSFPHYLQYDFGSNNPVTINKYAIQQQNSTTTFGFPKSFTLQGSNNNTTWITLDTRTNISIPAQSAWTSYFTFNNGAAYRYYRLRVTAVSGSGTQVSIAELKLICASMDGEDNIETNSCTTIMASNVVPAPKVVSASSEYYSEYRSSYYSAWKAFNGTNLGESDRWMSAISNSPWYIQYDFGSGLAVPINKYAIQEQNYNGSTVINGEIVQEQNYNSNVGFPRDFTFKGSNDGINWIVLDTRVNTAAPGMNKWSNWFTFINGVNYRYYRLNITATNSNLAIPVEDTSTTTPTDCVIVDSTRAIIRSVVVTQYKKAERTTAVFQTAGHKQTTLYSNQDLIITFNSYDTKGVNSAALWLDGVKITTITGPWANTTIGGMNFSVVIGKRCSGVHNYSIVATTTDGKKTTPSYACWFTVLEGGS